MTLVHNALDTASVAEHIIELTLIMVEVDISLIFMIDGVHAQHFSGTGVVIYHSKTMEIVVVDRYIVPISLSYVMLSFAAYSIEITEETTS